MDKLQRKLRTLPYYKKSAKSLNSIPEQLELEIENLSIPNMFQQNNQSNGSGLAGVPPVQPSGEYANLLQKLTIPDAIKNLPRYEGNPRTLHEFINNVEEILKIITGTDGTSYGQILLRAIRNKIEGKANEVLNMYNTPLNWDAIKNNLIIYYADKRSEASLLRDLHELRQYNKTVEEFYSDIINIQSSLCNNMMLNEKDEKVIKTKKDLFNVVSLNAFLVGLKEPLGGNIRAMRPDSLESALARCIEEQNIQYQKNEFKYPNRTPYFKNNNNTYSNTNNRQTYSTKPYYDNRAPNSYNTQYDKKPYNNNYYNNNNNYQGRKPNNNYHNNNNYNHSQSTPYNNNFRSNQHTNNQQNANYSKPEPMDTDGSGMSRYTNKTDHTMQSTQTRSNNQNRYDVNYIDNNEEKNNIEDVNFRQFASSNQPDI